MKIVDRNDFIVEKCRDRAVLDLGCVCHDLSEKQIKSGSWLHGNIKKVAKKLKGYDIEIDEIIKLRKIGYDIDYCNIELIDMVEVKKYDVIVLGSIIEHLFNPGIMLDAIKELCKEDTQIVLSTVNVWAVKYFIRAMFGKKECREDHVCWYSKYTLGNLLGLKGFEVIEWNYYNNYLKGINGIRPAIRKLQKWLMPFTSHGLVIVFKIKDKC